MMRIGNAIITIISGILVSITRVCFFPLCLERLCHLLPPIKEHVEIIPGNKS